MFSDVNNRIIYNMYIANCTVVRNTRKLACTPNKKLNAYTSTG